jgi:hypothetical protein
MASGERRVNPAEFAVGGHSGPDAGTSASLRPTIARGSRKTSGIAIKVVAELAITNEAKDKW